MSGYVPRLRRNAPRRGPLELTTVELPPEVLARVRRYAADSKLSLRTVFHSAVTEFLVSKGAVEGVSGGVGNADRFTEPVGEVDGSRG